MLKQKPLWILLLIFIIGSRIPLFSQVNPEIQLAARGVISFNTDFSSQTTTTTENDFSDSGLLLGFKQKLYNKLRAQLVIGFQFPDADSDLGQVFFHHTFIKVESKSDILTIGRTRVKSSLIEFPTLRDDDALYYTDALNPFSSGENSEENQYGNVLEGVHIFNQRYWLRIHGEHFTESPKPPAAFETDFSINAIGLSFQYRVPETQLWNRPFLQQVGIGLNNFLTDRSGYSSVIDRTLKVLSFSSVLNLKPDPVNFIDFRSQIIYNTGFDEIKQITNYPEMTRTKSLAAFTSIRYLYRRLERPTCQLSASFGYKTFPGLTNNSSQWQIVVSNFFRIGEKFDIAIQLQHQQFYGDLINIFSKNQTSIQVGFVYSIDQSWNNQFDDRESLLNLEHGYIP